MSPVLDTAGRLRRLLAILTWLAQTGEADVDDLASRFGLRRDELVAELEMAACCGLPPYTPDQLMEIVVTDRTVSARLGSDLGRPRRLTPAEGFALAASARAVLAVAGSDPNGALARALRKLDDVLGTASVGIDLDAPEHLEVVQDAAINGYALAISYYSASSDRLSERVIEPDRVFTFGGHWYTDAFCRLSGGARRFRVDRMSSARRLSPEPSPGEQHGEVRSRTAPTRPDPGGPADGVVFVPGPETRTVRIAVDPRQAWRLQPLATPGSWSDEGGRTVCSVEVGGTAWLERLMLQLGSGAKVLEPVDDREVRQRAASRIVARYHRKGKT